jgi:lysozyme
MDFLQRYSMTMPQLATKSKVGCLLAFCLLSLTLLCSCKEKQSENDQVYGVDLSHHNTVEDWDKVTASFVYLKATEGESHQDDKFRSFAKRAKQQEIAVGAYHFMTTSSSAKNQFENFYREVKGVKLDLLPVLDIERQTKGYPVSKEKLRSEVRVFVELSKKHFGKAPIIYCSQPFYTKYFLGHFDDCKYWCGDVDCPAVLPHVMHQKTIKHVPAIKGKVDYNVLNCKLDDIKL